MINRLVVHRFRGIREGVLEDLGKINVLIGPNNSGKTAILELLYLGGVSGRRAQLILEDVPFGEKDIESVIKATVPMQYDFLGAVPMPRLRKRHGHKGQWEENPAVLTPEGGIAVNLESLTKNATLRGFRVGAPPEEWSEKISLKFTNKDIGSIASISLNGNKNIPKVLIPSLFEKWGILSEQSRWHYLWDPIWVYRWEQQEFIDHFAVWAEEGIGSDPERVLFFDFHNANDHFEKRFAQWAKNHIINWEGKISERMEHVFPALKGASVRVDNAPGGLKGETGYIQFPGKVRLPVDLFGDGIRHSFKVLASIVALAEVVDEKHPGIFLWEDPELFMHPATLGLLMKEVIGVVKERPIQAFISTHSLDVLAWISQMLNEKFVDSKSIKAYSLTLKSSGELKTRQFHGDDILSWMKSGFDLRDPETAMVDLFPLSWRLKPSNKEEILW